MTNANYISDIPRLSLFDKNAPNLSKQLAHLLRQAVANGELKSGDRLPSSRSMARTLLCSRWVVIEAFDQLIAEGYLEAKTGSGTIVSQGLDHKLIKTNKSENNAKPTLTLKNKDTRKRFEARLRALEPQVPRPFAIAVPKGGASPGKEWAQICKNISFSSSVAIEGYSDPAGDEFLRFQVAEYLRTSRGLECMMDQILITSGAQQAIYIIARTLFDKDDFVGVEDPAYPGITEVLSEVGLKRILMPIDDQGASLPQDTKVSPKAVFLTPSHQYPLGMPMSIERRTEFVSWANKTGSWLIEDDYDCEFRHVGHPFQALQKVAPNRTIYIGTFSKTLFPALRIGFIVAPKEVISALLATRCLIDRFPPTLEQKIVAMFFETGGMARHIKRIRRVFAERRRWLVELLEENLADQVEVQPGDQGMHVLVWLKYLNDLEVQRLAKDNGVVVRAISPMYGGNKKRSGLMLGFGGFDRRELRHAVNDLGIIMRKANE